VWEEKGRRTHVVADERKEGRLSKHMRRSTLTLAEKYDLCKKGKRGAAREQKPPRKRVLYTCCESKGRNFLERRGK